MKLLGRLEILALLATALCGCAPDDVGAGQTQRRLDSDRESLVPVGEFVSSDGAKYTIGERLATYSIQLRVRWDRDENQNVMPYVLTINGKDRLLELFEEGDQAVFFAPRYKDISPSALPGSFKPFGSIPVAWSIEKSVLDTICVAKPGDWIEVLKDMPIQRGSSTLSISWAGCDQSEVCRDTKTDSDTEVLDISSDGKVLISQKHSAKNVKQL